MIGVSMVGLDEGLKTLQGPIAAHLIQQHPEDPAPLVVSHGVVAIAAAIDLDEGSLGVRVAALGVACLEPLAEVDAGGGAFHLIDEQDRREMRRALGKDVSPRSFSRGEDVSPPLVGRLVRGDLESEVDLGGVRGQEPDSLGE